MMDKFRLLNAEEIDVRVARVKNNGLSLLLYKDARVDQNILDETFGIFGWQRSHQLIGDRLYCTVSVKDPNSGEWISKQDVGTESYTEKEKGQASDSFKRACFNLGIGRELYSAPFIWVNADKCDIKNGNSGNPTTYDHFRVKSIGYKDRQISHLVIVNDSRKGAVVYTLGATVSEDNTKQGKKEGPAAVEDKRAYLLKNLKVGCANFGIDEGKLAVMFDKTSIDELTEVQLQTLQNKWGEIKGNGAYRKNPQPEQGLPKQESAGDAGNQRRAG